jgi:lysine/ornithine N-monooxygenase
MLVHDVIGIGFGPSNIALAIALEENRIAGKNLDVLFIEKQPDFVWHQHMLLDNAGMQISFLKDLATLRNPTSRFTFVNYLHEKNRLQDFINLKTFFPSRHEFNDYFAWAAGHFRHQCRYDEEVVNILPEKRSGKVTLLRVVTRDAAGKTYEHLTRNLVLGIGGSANIPEPFLALGSDSRVFHSSRYLRDIAKNSDAGKIALIGAGQSAAEIFMDLHGRHNQPQIDLIMRARAIKPSDDSPFVNQIFDVDFVDEVFGRDQQERADLLLEFRNTNYACPDMELIESIFQVFYLQKVIATERHRMLRRHQVSSARAHGNGICLELLDLDSGRASLQHYDAVVLATGYKREHHKPMLAALRPYLDGFRVDRNYRLATTDDFTPAIFLQGACESTHGLSDTLLSVTAVRTGEIGDALLAACPSQRWPQMQTSIPEQA